MMILLYLFIGSKISFLYQSAAALDFGKDSVKQVNITINSDRLQVHYTSLKHMQLFIPHKGTQVPNLYN